MTIKDVFAAYEKEFSYEKQCEWKPYDFSSLRWGHGMYDFFKNIFLTDQVKKQLADARLVLNFDFDKEMTFGVVKMSLTMHKTHPLATKAIRNGKASCKFCLFKITRKKRPDNGWAWTTCKRYFDDRDTKMSIEDFVSTYIKVFKDMVLDKIEEALEDLAVYDRMATYAKNEWPLVMTTDQLNRVVALVQSMSFTNHGILDESVYVDNNFINILKDDEPRKKVLVRLEEYKKFKQSM